MRLVVDVAALTVMAATYADSPRARPSCAVSGSTDLVRSLYLEIGLGQGLGRRGEYPCRAVPRGAARPRPILVLRHVNEYKKGHCNDHLSCIKCTGKYTYQTSFTAVLEVSLEQGTRRSSKFAGDEST